MRAKNSRKKKVTTSSFSNFGSSWYKDRRRIFISQLALYLSSTSVKALKAFSFETCLKVEFALNGVSSNRFSSKTKHLRTLNLLLR